MKLVPKNWETFQHYKDRCPPWIKLHRDLLNDRAFMRLPTASKALAPMLWLLASESKDGEFDGSIEELEFRLRMPQNELSVGLKALIENGFFLVASGALADCLLVATPETETEREAETETEKKKRVSRAPFPSCPDDVDQQIWADWCQLRKAKRAPVNPTVINGARREAAKAEMTLGEFLAIWCRRGSQGLEADWLKPAERGRAKAAPRSFNDVDYGESGLL